MLHVNSVPQAMVLDCLPRAIQVSIFARQAPHLVAQAALPLLHGFEPHVRGVLYDHEGLRHGPAVCRLRRQRFQPGSSVRNPLLQFSHHKTNLLCSKPTRLSASLLGNELHLLAAQRRLRPRPGTTEEPTRTKVIPKAPDVRGCFLHGCLTQGRPLDELIEALAVHLEGTISSGDARNGVRQRGLAESTELGPQGIRDSSELLTARLGLDGPQLLPQLQGNGIEVLVCRRKVSIARECLLHELAQLLLHQACHISQVGVCHHFLRLRSGAVLQARKPREQVRFEGLSPPLRSYFGRVRALYLRLHGVLEASEAAGELRHEDVRAFELVFEAGDLCVQRLQHHVHHALILVLQAEQLPGDLVLEAPNLPVNGQECVVLRLRDG
mmetsp:Transcript_49462/g.132354  ORF Transcript_49462/g.132354 Transcript_49462/m.132354 type:complete len:382 (+) Transcript_49462:1162-2307(+)